MLNKNKVWSLFLPLALAAASAWSANAPANIEVDVSKNRHAIDPRIYGVAWGNKTQLADLNVPLNRHGGNPTSRYNWMADADNKGWDWYFESIGYGGVPGEFVDSLIGGSKTAGAEPQITIPMTDWIANLGNNGNSLASFSIAKYGPQTTHDPNGFNDAGGGVSKATGNNIAGNDPNDANVHNSTDYQKQWIQHMIDKWGGSQNGGVKYYNLDNEPTIWFEAHRDVQPTGLKMDDYLKKVVDYASMIRETDPNAVILGPEEWGWSGFFYSGYDQQYGRAHNFQSYPDKQAHGGVDYLPRVLDQLHKYEMNNGKRLLDVFTVHYYPQGGEFNSDEETSTKTQLLRNRSTRSLWDPNYKDESWINDKVMLVPRLKSWVNQYYPGLQIGLTEYNWGAEEHISGATAQADVLGILGREGVDLANRWVTPEANTPTYKAIQLYRNYDGNKSTFGDTSVAADGPNPDDVAVFAAQRSSDDAVTVMVVNKSLTGDTPVNVRLSNFEGGAQAEEWQLTSKNVIERKADAPINAGSLTTTVPAQSITLFVVPKAAVVDPPVVVPPVENPPAANPTFTSSATAVPATVAPGADVTITVTVTGVTGTLENGIVDVELYNSKGEKVAQNFWDKQSFTANPSAAYDYHLSAPMAEGVYEINVGVFTSGWAENPHWNNVAGTLTVKKDSPVAVLKGDLNGDRQLTIADVVLALRMAVGIIVPTPTQLVAGDLDGNGKITITDASKLIHQIIGG